MNEKLNPCHRCGSEAKAEIRTSYVYVWHVSESEWRDLPPFFRRRRKRNQGLEQESRK